MSIVVITTAINFAALVFLGAQVMLARNALKETADEQEKEWKRQRRKSSLDALLATTRYRESLKGLPWNDRDPIAVEAFLKYAKGDRQKLSPLREYLNHLENVAVGVRQDVFDLETISMSEGGRIIDIFANYRPYIETVRQEIDKPRLYSEIEYLAKELKEFRRRQESARTVPDEGQGGNRNIAEQDPHDA